MKTVNFVLSICLLLLIVFLFITDYHLSSNSPKDLTGNDYARAEQFLPWNTYNMVSGDEVVPRFLEDGRFWFRSHTESGHEFVLVDPATKNREVAFDHDRLAAGLSALTDTTYEGHKLPFREFRFLERENSIQFFISDSIRWTCNTSSYE